ncbi:MAG: FAD-dependent oxidoreductase, partial [Clostridia bacterium]|nr:FAD-dependent oxidoreductase [Clostridia bacterium]
LLLLGGGGERTGKPSGNWQELRHFAKENYTKSKERFFFATQDCISLDSMPYIGQYSKNTPNLYVAGGFNKWGMTGAMVSAMVLSDIIMNKQNDFADIFNPSRNILKPQLFVNGIEATKNLLTISEKRCPHLGCALKWNNAEHSWDCPCHGSRFAKSGTLIDNPANGDLKL